jgi:integrase
MVLSLSNYLKNERQTSSLHLATAINSGLEKNEEGQTRTLYSLRHTYATLELIENRTDIYTLAKQMGNRAAMIERHYSKLTATMAADRLA